MKIIDKDYRILFLPLHTASLLEMLPIDERLANDHNIEPIFYIFRKVSEHSIDELKNRKFRLLGAENRNDKEIAESSPSISSPGADGIKNQGLTRRLSKYLFSRPFFAFWLYLLKYFYLKIKSRRLLKRESIDILITIGDRHVGWETALIKAANHLGIPSLIVPFAVSDPLGSVEFRRRHPNSSSFVILWA